MVVGAEIGNSYGTKRHFLKMDPSCSLSKGFASHGYTWQIAHTHTMKTSIIVEFWNVAKHAPNPSTLLWDWQIFLYDFCHFVCLKISTWSMLRVHLSRGMNFNEKKKKRKLQRDQTLKIPIFSFALIWIVGKKRLKENISKFLWVKNQE